MWSTRHQSNAQDDDPNDGSPNVTYGMPLQNLRSAYHHILNQAGRQGTRNISSMTQSTPFQQPIQSVYDRYNDGQGQSAASTDHNSISFNGRTSNTAFSPVPSTIAALQHQGTVSIPNPGQSDRAMFDTGRSMSRLNAVPYMAPYGLGNIYTSPAWDSAEQDTLGTNSLPGLDDGSTGVTSTPSNGHGACPEIQAGGWFGYTSSFDSRQLLETGCSSDQGFAKGWNIYQQSHNLDAQHESFEDPWSAGNFSMNSNYGQLTGETTNQRAINGATDSTIANDESQNRMAIEPSSPPYTDDITATIAGPSRSTQQDKSGSLEETNAYTYPSAASLQTVDFSTVWQKSTPATNGQRVKCCFCKKSSNCNRDAIRCGKCWEKWARNNAPTPRFSLDPDVADLQAATRLLHPRLSPLSVPDDDVHVEKLRVDDYISRMLEAIVDPYVRGKANEIEGKENFLCHQQFVFNGNAAVERKFYNDAEVTARLRYLFQMAVEYHEGTQVMLSPLEGDCKNYSGLACKFSQRMADIERILTLNKRVAMDVIENRATMAIVVNPQAYHSRKLQNSSSNVKKGERIKMGRQARDDSEDDGDVFTESTGEVPPYGSAGSSNCEKYITEGRSLGAVRGRGTVDRTNNRRRLRDDDSNGTSDGAFPGRKSRSRKVVGKEKARPKPMTRSKGKQFNVERPLD